MSNLSIANIFLFVTILCLALSAYVGDARSFLFSMGAIVLAGMMRHTELQHQGRARPRT